ncbi:hypothetical protein [Mesorhizobium sp. L48C026A00]|uniref:hypothetical protein n=1 Tax=Mesorhizobium sp. L48C026A00 TaxID=1287182 RepID=UPI0003CFBA7B|nr:hypothetical protein [Mesorhizobium sp. L48C026A00]ESZ11927.1 hypothetical protein X737_29085 [Mesorhizobium sp. L48C026A00]
MPGIAHWLAEERFGAAKIASEMREPPFTHVVVNEAQDISLAELHLAGRRLIEASDERALKEIYDTERHLLYVAATRARERLWSPLGAYGMAACVNSAAKPTINARRAEISLAEAPAPQFR